MPARRVLVAIGGTSTLDVSMMRCAALCLWGLALVGLLGACEGSPPHVVLTVNASADLSSEIARLGISADAGRSKWVDVRASSFPLTVTLRARQTGARLIRVLAEDATEEVVARGVTDANFRRSGTPTAAVTLASSCETDLDCDPQPACLSGLTCESGMCLPETRRCVAVAYVSPRNDAVDVPLEPTLLLAFNQEVRITAAAEATTLTRVLTGADIPLTIATTDLSGAFELTPQTPLEPDTEYRLAVASGVAPEEPTAGLPSIAPYEVRFRTVVVDRTPPAPVGDAVVDWQQSDRVALSWVNPTDADFAGVLILRSSNTEVSGVPSDGTIYSVGSVIDDATVIGWTQQESWVDATAITEQSGYAFFTFDGHANYSTAVRPPRIVSLEINWCADETGSVLIAAQSADAQQLFITDAPGQPIDELYPSPPDALGTTALPATAITVGQAHWLRAVVSGPGGQTWTLEESFVASPGVLTPTAISPVAGTSGAASALQFTPHAWTAFEAELYPEASPSDTVSIEVVDSLAVATIDDARTYVIRVRPLVPMGCAAAPWTLSAPFTWAANFIYVAPSGNGDGSSPMSPLDSVRAALAAATSDTDILVGVGTYTDTVGTSLTLIPRVRLLGGYDAAFNMRDADAHASVLVGSIFSMSGAEIDGSTVVEGFDIRPRVSAVSENYPRFSVYGGAGSTLRNNRIESRMEAIWIADGDGLQIIDNDIVTTSGGIAIHAGVSANTVIQDNVIEPMGSGEWNTGIELCGSTSSFPNAGDNNEIANNRIVARTAVDVRTCANTRVVGNELIGNAGMRVRDGASDILVSGNLFTSVPVLGESFGLKVQTSTSVHITNNRLYVRDTTTCEGVNVLSSTGVTIASNLLVAVGCNSSLGAVLLGEITFTNNTVHVEAATAPYGIQLTTPNPGFVAPTISVINNIIAAEGTSPRALWEVSYLGNEPASLENNLLIASDSLLFDQFTSDSFTSIEDLEAALCARGTHAVGNIELTTVDGIFIDADGSDDVLRTFEDNDWRTRPDEPLATAGGKDTSQNTCGTGADVCQGLGDDTCGNVTVDIDGVPRTVPYSIGAYEVD